MKHFLCAAAVAAGFAVGQGSAQEASLHEAIIYSDFAFVESLIKKGADVNAIEIGMTPLYFAMEIGSMSIARLLIDSGANVNIDENALGWAPLHFAAASNNLPIAKLLIDACANVNAKTDSGETPLHFAARDPIVENYCPRKYCPWQYSNRRIAQTLIDAGANVNAPDEDGWTPLHFAATGRLRMAQLLIDRGANVNAPDEDGWTPLHFAATGRLRMAQTLIDRGADMNAETNGGETPLHLAAAGGKPKCSTSAWLTSTCGKRKRKGNLPVVELLIDRGADMNAETNGGETPLERAAAYGNLPVVEFLIDRGASM